MASRYNPVRPRSGRRRATDWELGFVSTSATNVAAGAAVLVGSISAALLDPEAPGTIIRTRGRVMILSDNAAAGENQIGAMGISLVSDQARSAGIASIPSPVSQATWDGWFVFKTLYNGHKIAGTNLVVSAATFEIDSKAMRKFEGDQAIVLVVENANVVDHSFDFFADIRFLLKAG